ncbi:MAG: hypothetical protein O2807_12910 [bacterium]|nr:hypothetical protein [bacterium]
MIFFRSEEDLRSWWGFEPGTGDAVMPLGEYGQLWGIENYRARAWDDYITQMPGLQAERWELLEKLGRRTTTFWDPPPPPK